VRVPQVDNVAPADNTNVVMPSPPDIKNLQAPNNITSQESTKKAANINLGPKKDSSSSDSVKMSPFVRKQLDHVMQSEKGYVDSDNDPGGKTKYGIAETKEWTKAASYLGLDANPENIKNLTQEQAEKYYLHSRFERFRLASIQNVNVANAIFDLSVLTPELINKNIKKSLNSMGYNFEINNKNFTREQVDAINSVDPDLLVEIFTSYELKHFESIKRTNPANYNDHIKGWKNRLNRLNNYK
jgi:lysozyme family protein